jgi:hypothetical protein
MEERRMVSEDQLEALIAKRLKERQEIISEAVTALKPELDRMSREIASANHIKRTLGSQIRTLSRAVRTTNLELRQHSALRGHPGTEAEITEIKQELEQGEELMQQFGITDLSTEQRKAFPAVLKAFVVTSDEQLKQEADDRKRQAWIHVGSSFLSALLGAVAAATGFIAWLSAHPIKASP